jgi:beta-glucosidase
LSQSRIGVGGTVTVSVDVANTGGRAGDEVVQLYIRDTQSSVTQPVKELKGFERVTLAPGERKTVTFTLGPRDFALWNIDMKHVVEPGTFEIMAGPDSQHLKSVMLEVS